MIDVQSKLNCPRESKLLAEFTQVEPMLAALEALRREQYHDLETFTPYDVEELDLPLGLQRTKLGWLSAAGGLLGLALSYGIQWWANVHSYPLNAGGRPAHAAPGFVLATFEGTVLGAALAAFIGLFLLLRYPRPWAVEDEIEGFERATIDRFWIGLATFTNEQDREHAAAILLGHGALRTVKVGDL